MSIPHFLSSGGPVSPPFWGIDLGFVKGDVQEDRGGFLWVSYGE